MLQLVCNVAVFSLTQKCPGDINRTACCTTIFLKPFVGRMVASKLRCDPVSIVFLLPSLLPSSFPSSPLISSSVCLSLSFFCPFSFLLLSLFHVCLYIWTCVCVQECVPSGVHRGQRRKLDFFFYPSLPLYKRTPRLKEDTQVWWVGKEGWIWEE